MARYTSARESGSVIEGVKSYGDLLLKMFGALGVTVVAGVGAGLGTYGVLGSAFDRVPEGTELWGVEVSDELALFGAILAGVVAVVIAGSTVGKDIALR